MKLDRGTKIKAFLADLFQYIKYSSYALASSKRKVLRGKVSDHANMNAGYDIRCKAEDRKAWDTALDVIIDDDYEKRRIEEEYISSRRSGYNYTDNSVKMDDM